MTWEHAVIFTLAWWLSGTFGYIDFAWWMYHEGTEDKNEKERVLSFLVCMFFGPFSLYYGVRRMRQRYLRQKQRRALGGWI